MIRVQQSLERGWDAFERGEEPGDCMRACIASIFELALTDVPHFTDTGLRRDGNKLLWWYAWLGWAQTRGCTIYRLKVCDRDALALPGYCLLSGISPRAEPGTTSLRHVCVGWNGQIAWDPHSSGDGLRTIDEADFVVPLTADANALLSKAPL